jgi:hypothetical protein
MRSARGKALPSSYSVLDPPRYNGLHREVRRRQGQDNQRTWWLTKRRCSIASARCRPATVVSKASGRDSLDKDALFSWSDPEVEVAQEVHAEDTIDAMPEVHHVDVHVGHGEAECGAPHEANDVAVLPVAAVRLTLRATRAAEV